MKVEQEQNNIQNNINIKKEDNVNVELPNDDVEECIEIEEEITIDAPLEEPQEDIEELQFQIIKFENMEVNEEISTLIKSKYGEKVEFLEFQSLNGVSEEMDGVIFYVFSIDDSDSKYYFDYGNGVLYEFSNNEFKIIERDLILLNRSSYNQSEEEISSENSLDNQNIDN